MIIILEYKSIYWDKSGKTTCTTHLVRDGCFTTIAKAKKWLNDKEMSDIKNSGRTEYHIQNDLRIWKNRRKEKNKWSFDDDDVTTIYEFIEMGVIS